MRVNPTILAWIIALATLVASAIAYPIALPGCKDTCGNITVPYPFGIGVSSETGKNCFMNNWFNLTCNESSILLLTGNAQVLDISKEGQLDLSFYIGRACYNKTGYKTFGSQSPSLNTPVFTINSTENKFLSVGCDSYGCLDSYQGDKQYSTGCITKCLKGTDENNNETCSGIGCCQVDVPVGMKNFTIKAASADNQSKVLAFNNCSYAFLAKRGSYKFSTSHIDNGLPNQSFPLVVDWTVGNKTSCEDAESKLDYACGKNSHCNITDHIEGYRCICDEGYEGNPYLPEGCQNINECQLSKHNCVSGSDEYCVDLEGSFSCRCPSGYDGNGTKEGSGCRRKDLLTKIVIGISSSLGSIVLLVGLWWLYKIVKKRRIQNQKDKFFKQNGGLLLQKRLSSGEANVEKTTLFTLKELEKATDHFNTNRILGKGGQGTVYKGMLVDGKIVAVKKFKLQGNAEEFINEFIILSQINHRNVVKLLGCCLETKVPLLVYEFIPNGTVFQYLHEPNQDLPMTWEVRLRIATEIAGALFYLHSAASQPIYHRDIKSTNILLDEKFRAKIADFGSSRMVSIEDTHLTTLVQGTFGYLDPEYFHTSQFTEKSDVYSFGVVLVELLTGQKPISSIRPEEGKSLASYFIMRMEENHLFDIVDERVKKEGHGEHIMAVAYLAKRCLNLSGRKRPTMREVTMELEAIQKFGKKSDNSHQNWEEIDLVEGGTFQSSPALDSMTIAQAPKWETSSSSEVLPLVHFK